MTRDDRLRFETAVRALHGELRRAARRLAGPVRADDLVQETLLRALVAWHRVEPDRNPRPWMHAILRNACADEYRRSRREELCADEPHDPKRHDPATAIDLRRALDKLPANLRETLVAVDGEGLLYREAAERTGTPIGTVMSRLARARERVAALLAA
jgi:RNA polymerase sigma-70 factor (ECF subfamily)